MQFSLAIAFWKALRSALLATLVVAMTAGTVDVFFDSFSTGLSSVVPAWAIPIVAAGLTVLRNLVKQWANRAK